MDTTTAFYAFLMRSPLGVTSLHPQMTEHFVFRFFEGDLKPNRDLQLELSSALVDGSFTSVRCDLTTLELLLHDIPGFVYHQPHNNHHTLHLAEFEAATHVPFDALKLMTILRYRLKQVAEASHAEKLHVTTLKALSDMEAFLLTCVPPPLKSESFDF